MKLTEIHLKNIRCFESLTLPLKGLTVLLGDNGTGKTTVFDAIRFALLTYRDAPGGHASFVLRAGADEGLVRLTFDDAIVLECKALRSGTRSWSAHQDDGSDLTQEQQEALRRSAEYETPDASIRRLASAPKELVLSMLQLGICDVEDFWFVNEVFCLNIHGHTRTDIELSAGERAYVENVALMFDERAHTLVGFDDADAFIAPGLQPRIASIFEQISERWPVLISTHGRRLLDAIEFQREEHADLVNAVLLEHWHGAVRARWLDRDSLRGWCANRGPTPGYDGLGAVIEAGYSSRVFFRPEP